MQDPDGKLGKLAILDELAQMGQSGFSTVLDEADHVKDGLHHGMLEVVTSFVPQNS